MLGETIVTGKNMERALSPRMINKNSLTSIKVNGHFVDHLGGILEVVATIYCPHPNPCVILVQFSSYLVRILENR
jgi:hypothetical protein